MQATKQNNNDKDMIVSYLDIFWNTTLPKLKRLY